MNEKQENKLTIGERLALWFMAIVLILIFCAILWSYLSDTLIPLIQQGNYLHAAFNLFGFIVMMVGLGFFVYGGFLFLTVSYQALLSPQLKANRERIHANLSRESVKIAKRENLLFLWKTWKPSFLWLGLGILLFALGAPFT
ncbi:MAG: hypothetical protein J7L73_05840 [Anaerolineales bacterium]|nr:hypothetical protein [Anaerolineales bacterium]